MKVHWTATAIAHLVAIYEHVAQNSPVYAQKIVDKLTRRSEQIAIFPMSGRIVPEYEAQDIREVIEKPYRIIYRIKPDQVDILTVLHSAQLLPDKLP